MTKVGQILSELELIIESNNLIAMINGNSDEALAIALIDKFLAFTPWAVEAKMLGKCFEVRVRVEILTLLENTDC